MLEGANVVELNRKLEFIAGATMSGFRGRLIAILILFVSGVSSIISAGAQDRINLRQGWSNKTKADWYTRSQGSRLIPLSWLLALEQPGSQQRFLDDAFIEKYRYLPAQSNAPDRLPVGFAVNQQDDSELSVTRLRWKSPQSSNEKWVGMNCAACHTGEITYNGKRVRIEGGPTLADFQGFMEALNEALRETRATADKKARFAAKILAEANTVENRAMLDSALDALIKWQSKIEKANATPLRYGFGRLDAFGNIFNKVALVIAKGKQETYPPNAPVSYPFLWNVPQHDKVQWNGIVSNTRVGQNYDIGALGRNVGEVTGVFADVRLSSGWPRPKIVSSADVTNLNLLEEKLRTLRPPLWPTGMLGKLDQAKRDWGREIFRGGDARAKDRKFNGQQVVTCQTCHLPLGRNNLRSLINARMISLKDSGTDIWMACNALTREAKTGWLESTLYGYIPFVDRESRYYGETATLADLLRTTVIGTIWAKKRTVVGDILDTFRFPQPSGLGSPTEKAPSVVAAAEQPVRAAAKEARGNKCENGEDPLLAYKARPLTGIWATAPYLHNGSVPTLYDLLLPPAERPKSFPVGTREYDPVRVGYVTRTADGQIAQASTDSSFMFNTHDAAGNLIDGNSNAGHDYGNAAYTDDERWALVEYLKGL